MSESFAIELGSELPLGLTLPRPFGVGRFPRARIYDSVGSEVAGSPFDLMESPVASAKYLGPSFTPLAVGNFVAHFIVFSDGAHLVENFRFKPSQDSYVVTDPAAFGYVAADRTRDDQIAVETAAIDGRLPPDPADASDLAAAHASILSTGGPGPWTGLPGVSDWSAAERENIRDALGVDGTKTVATGGQLQTLQGTTFDASTDTLEEIRDAIDNIAGTGIRGHAVDPSVIP